MPGTYISPAETRLYYLQTRYYDPELGRFINADAFASTGQGIIGNNMFAYGLNNPMRFVDRDGAMASEGIIAATNWWNPVGWASAALFVVEVIGLVVTISLVDELLDNPPVVFESEHTKNKRPSTKGKHEKGQTRKKRDQGGEKKEQKKGWVPNRNKRNSIINTGRMRVWKNDRTVHEMF